MSTAISNERYCSAHYTGWYIYVHIFKHLLENQPEYKKRLVGNYICMKG